MDENKVEVMEGTDIPLPPENPIDDGIVVPDDGVEE
mgnify:CR=1 FL=1